MCNSPKFFTVHPAIHFNHAWITLNSSFASVDHSRVKLTLTTSKNDTDYINANFIKVCQQRTCAAAYLLHYFLPLAYNNLKCASVQRASFDDTDTRLHFCLQGVSGSRTYIATQGPLPNTVVDFLRMIWEYGIKVHARRRLRTQQSVTVHLSQYAFIRIRGGTDLDLDILLLIKVFCGYFSDSYCHVCPKVVVMACREFEMGKVSLCSLQTEQLLHSFAELALIE